MRINKKKGELDKELPYTLSELSVLASTGLSPIQILRSISKKTDNEYMRQEFRKVIYKIDMEGKDIITSLGESAKETPSLHLREALYDFANMIHEGGSIDNYLRKKADQGMSLRRDLQRELIESMSVLMELYLSLVLVVILLTGVGSFLLDVMGQRAGGMSANEILIVVSFFFIPMAIFTVIMFVSTAFSKVE
jgi:flagellar protein FlaJ